MYNFDNVEIRLLFKFFKVVEELFRAGINQLEAKTKIIARDQ